MMRALSAGVQGMRVHQIRMDVIGNNISNVNTTAFKASRVNFAEQYNQTMQGATSPGIARGGVNPKQVGLGVGVSSIDTIQEPGNLQATGKATDLAISGNGFFVLRDGGRFVYTRAGTFDFDSDGYLVNPASGQRVQGWMPNKATGLFPPRDISQMKDIQLPVADAVLASPTTLVGFDQSLNAEATAYTMPGAAPYDTNPATHTAAMTVIDSLGKEHTITLKFFKRQDNVWDIMAYNSAGVAQTLSQPYTGVAPILPATNVGTAIAGASRIEFNADGSLRDPDGNANTPFNINLTGFNPGGGASVMNVTLDFSKVIQPAIKGNQGISTMRMLDYNGYPTGALDRIYVDQRGVITGYYTNGQYREVGQVAMANFFNPAGLLKDGNNNWIESPNSGWALIGAAGDSGRGLVASNNLEMSNVDISQEFTNMIVTQRGFQANSRIITTSDEMLQEVVNLKR